jgi:transcriptional regulator with XRE-family HTH domain
MARDWAAVATAITTRLAELEMTQQELAARSGVSVATLRQLQRGMERRRNPRTLAAVSSALQWPDGHLGEIAESTLAPGHPATPSTRAVQTGDAEAMGELRRVVAALGDRIDAIERRLDVT